jgi:ParB-like chromosome segregation protein Spo0J
MRGGASLSVKADMKKSNAEVTLECHPIANIFPLMTEQEMDLLVNDIAAHGQREPALVFEGKILDGRNRAIACERAGEKLKTKQFKGTRQQALEHVWSTNFARRHMTSSQRAMVTAERKKTDPAFAEQCELMDQEAAQRKAQAKGKPRGEKASEGESIPTETKDDRRTATVLAKASGTNRKYLELAEKIYDEHPEYVEPIKRGTVRKAMKASAKALREENPRKWTQEKLAVTFGVGQQRVSEWLSDTTNTEIGNGCEPPSAKVVIPKTAHAVHIRPVGERF